MAVKRFLFLAAVTASVQGWAANITISNKNNPAHLAATLEVSCERAVENFEKSMRGILVSVPFVSDVRVMTSSDWKEESKTVASTVSSRTLNLSVTPTLAREFPPIFLPVIVSRTVCTTGATGCTNQHVFNFDGTQAVVYQKVFEASRSQTYLHSFSGTMIFKVVDASNCTLENILNINNNAYLWVKRHLVGNLDLGLIEAGILGRFVDWARSILPVVEAK